MRHTLTFLLMGMLLSRTTLTAGDNLSSEMTHEVKTLSVSNAGIIELELQVVASEDQVILVKNEAGCTMILKMAELQSGLNQVQLDLKNLDHGQYYVTDEKGHLFGKVIKQ